MTRRKSQQVSRVTGQASIKQRIREALRAVFTKFHQPRKAVLAEARRLQPRVKVNGEEAAQPSVRYECADCGELWKATEIAVDHMEPVGATPEWPPQTEGDWERWMLKLLCEPDNLQCLCKNCHLTKTREEARDAAERRRDGSPPKKRATGRPRVVGAQLGRLKRPGRTGSLRGGKKPNRKDAS